MGKAHVAPPTRRSVINGKLPILEVRDGRIRVIDHFMAASSHAAFFAGGLPRTIAAHGADRS
ncbi:MAG: hypothetical protein H7138_15950 [Myxococcales bacterium]|nr:hypothetical protein [Myxococcales bacterium]